MIVQLPSQFKLQLMEIKLAVQLIQLLMYKVFVNATIQLLLLITKLEIILISHYHVLQPVQAILLSLIIFVNVTLDSNYNL